MATKDRHSGSSNLVPGWAKAVGIVAGAVIGAALSCEVAKVVVEASGLEDTFDVGVFYLIAIGFLIVVAVGTALGGLHVWLVARLLSWRMRFVTVLLIIEAVVATTVGVLLFTNLVGS